MKNAKAVTFAILAITLALSVLVAPASAEKYVHPRGMFMSTFPQQILVFMGASGEFSVDLAVIIYPPWYFVEDLMGFDSVTLTIKLVTDCPLCRHTVGNPPSLLGAGSDGTLVAKWGTVTMTEEENGAFLLVPITFVITGYTGAGFYMLYLSAQADSSSATFQGWDQIPVSVSPAMLGNISS